MSELTKEKREEISSYVDYTLEVIRIPPDSKEMLATLTYQFLRLGMDSTKLFIRELSGRELACCRRCMKSVYSETWWPLMPAENFTIHDLLAYLLENPL